MSRRSQSDERQDVAVTIILKTNDPRLFPDNIDVSTVEAVSRLRRAVVDALPSLSRVVCVMSAEMAQLMHEAHRSAAASAGITDGFQIPPETYRAPGSEAPNYYPAAIKR